MGIPIFFSPRAAQDLEEIVAYIAIDNPIAAERIGRELVAHVYVLEDHPRLGKVVPEVKVETLREILKRPYRIVYRFIEEEPAIEIVRFWHGARGHFKF